MNDQFAVLHFDRDEPGRVRDAYGPFDSYETAVRFGVDTKEQCEISGFDQIVELKPRIRKIVRSDWIDPRWEV